MSGFWKGFGTLFKRYFVSGLLVIIPIVGTIWILKVLILYADGLFTGLLPARLQPDVLFGRDIPGIGLVITIGLVLLAGVLTRLYIGRKVVHLGDRIIAKIPLGRGIYNSIKKFMGAFVSDDEQKQYRRVVAVEYPRRGCYMVGFMVGKTQPALQERFDHPWVSIFLPTSPNPTSGFMISVPEKEVIPLPISVEKAFKYIISGSVDHAPSPQKLAETVKKS
jgi:uncharacterized membrane protein